MMPIYEYECKKGHLTEEIFPITDFPEEITCPVCKSRSKKIISLSVRRDISGYPYVEEHLGEVPVLVESPEHRKKLMKERGLREYRSNRLKGFPGSWY